MVLILAAASAGFASRAAHCQNVPPGLIINLYVSDERIIIYSGAQNGLQKGQRFSVLRYGAQIALIEITEVRAVTSIARVITKLENVRNADRLTDDEFSNVHLNEFRNEFGQTMYADISFLFEKLTAGQDSFGHALCLNR